MEECERWQEQENYNSSLRTKATGEL
jgi:hypothetical protein